MLDYCQRGTQPTYWGESGLPVVNSKHVRRNRIVMENNRIGDPGTKSLKQIRFDDVLINGTGVGTIGRSAPYLESKKALPDNHVTILRSKVLDSVYRTIFLNSIAGQCQVEMHQRGSSGQLELYPQDIRRFLVWKAPQELQREIRTTYKKAMQLEKESNRLLEQAKGQVEKLIEDAVQT